MIASVLEVLAVNRTAWRRARNLRAGARSGRTARSARAGLAAVRRAPPVLRWLAAAGLVLALAGMAVIVFHARLLGRVATAGSVGDALVLRQALPGIRFALSGQPGITLTQFPRGALLVASGMQALPALHIDLCTQILDPTRPQLLPLRIGMPFDEVKRMAIRNEAAGRPATLRNFVLAGQGSGVPAIDITGTVTRDFSTPLALRWSGAGVRWIGDAGGGVAAGGEVGKAGLYQQGWMVLGPHSALHLVRRATAGCPQAGELVLQLFQPAGSSTTALVTAFPATGAPVTTRLPPGDYAVPVAAPPGLEDGVLFDQLRARGLLRLGRSGLIEMAPPDLAAWRAASPAGRAGPLPGWDGPALGATERQLIHRLYREADGDYLREQVRIFNGEHRLLAWRARTLPQRSAWRASTADGPVQVEDSTPGGAGRLFARLPQGWGPWSRVAAWPAGGAAGGATLVLQLAQPAAGGSLELMLAGRVTSVEGASLRERDNACTGRACPAPDAVQRLLLDLVPGARRVAITAQPIDASGLTDPQYRHLDVARGQLVWRVLDQGGAHSPAPVVQVSLADRQGTALWTSGHPTAQARAAGLATLLGIGADHTNSIAGMLARLPSAGNAHAARLTLDLSLQAAAQGALDCIGLRRGSWNGKGCVGGVVPPTGRQAGIVVMDADNGDLLVAAGAGSPPVDERNWDEVRDFDAANPGASPLRLPAFQHDGGSERSPGSTFKIISALGLELAARSDPALDALLGGMPLTAIDGIAHRRGFDFDTGAPAYPANSRRAHITNYGEQSLDRRAQEGRLGLEQALTYSLNTWFAWTAELSDRTLFGQPEGGVPDLQPLSPGALHGLRPIADMAARLGFGQPLRLDGGLLPAGYRWSALDALQATPSHIDPIHSRHELRQMAIGLRMQATPLQMAAAAAAVGQGHTVTPRLLSELDGALAQPGAPVPLGVRLDRIRAGMKGVIDRGTAASVFRPAAFDRVRPGLFGKTGTAPTAETDAAGHQLATVWFTGWLEPDTLPGQPHRLAFAVFASRSEATGGEHAAPVVAALLQALARHPTAY
jgi:cell division protein FtsI/penicillin-binding protein 2